MKRILFIVSRHQQDLVPKLEQQVRGKAVEVIVDRRKSHRRTQAGERRRAERRSGRNMPELDLIGVAVVVVS